MIPQAKVSIFIPLYNAEKYIAASIESVLHQTFTDWELLILDDCSTDQSFKIAKAFEERDRRIKVKRNAQNLGMMGNWNEGIRQCTSEYFVKLDADDVWHPQMLEKAIPILNTQAEVALVFTRYLNIDVNGNQIPDSAIELPDFAQNRSFSCVPLVQNGNFLAYSILRQGLSVMRRKVFDEIGLYRHLLTPETQASTDTEFYFRVGCHYLIYCLDEILYYYRVHTSSISATDKSRDLQEKKMYEIKYCIIEYYYSNNKINKYQRRLMLNNAKLDYQTYLIYKRRKERKYLKMLFLLLKLFLRFPAQAFSFYFRRLFEGLLLFLLIILYIANIT
ncbi:MAG: hypothetical protein OHK0053_24840 [Microscillaceae bacterium]